ncbi:MAG: protein kinase [Propionibacteriaceae bacterium]|nr:protein kinase [Propionibacteriaceae bacterium]
MSRAHDEAPQLAGYSYTGQLGASDRANVYLYVDAGGRRNVVKVLKDNSIDVRLRLEAHAGTLREVTRHPHLVTLRGVGLTETDHPFLIAEQLPGRSLAAAWRNVTYHPKAAAELGTKIADALAAAHQAGLWHGNIKPSKLLFNGDEPALADLGVRQILQGDTPNVDSDEIPFTPPEVLSGSVPHSMNSDVYGLAATLYALLTGRTPFEIPGGNNQMAAQLERIRSGQYQPTGIEGFPYTFELLLQSCLHPNPSRRPRTARSLADQLREIADSIPATFYRPSPPATPAPPAANTRPATPIPAPAPAPLAPPPKRKPKAAPEPKAAKPPKPAPAVKPKPQSKPKAAKPPKPAKPPKAPTGEKPKGKSARKPALIGTIVGVSALLIVAGILIIPPLLHGIEPATPNPMVGISTPTSNTPATNSPTPIATPPVTASPTPAATPELQPGTLYQITDNLPAEVGLSGIKTVTATEGNQGGDSDITQGSYFAIGDGGTVWAWGDNEVGQLGLGDTEQVPSPTQIDTLNNVTQISSRCGSSYALSGGKVYGWGQWPIGDGTTKNRHSPKQLPKLSGIAQVAASCGAGYALRGDGTVWAWGFYTWANTSTPPSSPTPKKIFDLNSITQIASGCSTSYALTAEGKIWAWGAGTAGQIGDGTTKNRTKPVQAAIQDVTSITATCDTAYALKTDGTVWAWGHTPAGLNTDTPTPTQIADNATSIQTGVNTLYIFQTDNTSTTGQPGQPLTKTPELDGFAAITSTSNTTIAVAKR